MDMSKIGLLAMGVILLWPVFRAVRGQQRDLEGEIERNGHVPAPDSKQIRWHIRHIRSDLMLICYALFGIQVTLLWIGFMLAMR